MLLQTYACLPMVAFRFEPDDHDDEGDGSSSGEVMIIMMMVITPKYASLIGHANAGVHIRPQRAKVTNPIPLHTWPQRHPRYIQSQLFDWIVCVRAKATTKVLSLPTEVILLLRLVAFHGFYRWHAFEPIALHIIDVHCSAALMRNPRIFSQHTSKAAPHVLYGKQLKRNSNM